ncbi:acyl-CoA thioesterase [Nocardia sp. CDC160]|uniref:acyl-CoA thioesterase n=1 Tax=Nocardia sp. CDC160 TaxID=3112166 RepID=UPI002DB89BB8|nr:hotdog domain-containing protein [Nocardia sp. CDC160]MEC3918014.1 hotdog domain-containing protein [Nocardia sp. CDC160]
MIFHTRRWIKPQDLNPNGSLFGGTLLAWLDEEAAIYAAGQLNNSRLVTKFISEIDFINPVRLGDVVELGVAVREFGRTSITLGCEVRNKATGQPVLTIEKIVFVNLDEQGRATPHGCAEVTETQMVHRAPAQAAAGQTRTPTIPPLARPPVAHPRVAPVGPGT